jgi:tRNA_anti-like
MNTQRNSVTLLVICVIWLVLTLGCSTLREGTNSRSSQSAPTNISAEDLYKTFQSNGVAAADRYKGKTLTVSGMLGNMGEAMGSTYVFLIDDHQTPMVECFFSDAQKDSLSRLKKGQTVSIKGTCTGLLGVVDLEDCVIQ